MTNQRIPVTILTGFLGAGKTTLLNRILSENHGKKIAVIENEFGEVGVDNELVIDADEEIFEMNNGCICCTVRGDLIRILTRLTKRKDKLDMILVETTGMANPAPVAQTFWVDNDLQEQFSLDAIITMVDAKHVHLHINDSDECKEQIAFADIAILNKSDLVSSGELEQIEATVRSMNAMCEIYTAENAAVDLNKLLNVNAFDLDKKIELNPKFGEEEFPFEAIVKYQLPKGKVELSLDEGPDPSIDVLISPLKDIQDQKNQATVAFSGEAIDIKANGELILDKLLQCDTTASHQSFYLDTLGGDYVFFTQHGPDEFNMQVIVNDQIIEPLEIIEIEHSHSHDDEVSSVGIEFTSPLNIEKFQTWISGLLQIHGPDIFRCKGILNFLGMDNRVVFQGVHMLFDAQPDRPWKNDEEKRNQLIFIGRNLDRNMLNTGIKSCLA
ncbi:MAG: cobalamin biosynthesis protein CobW [Flavobacteriales bacterium]|nr:cobalamin biosynthesis protein CobW [Flavobacteriales bacterium]|tara:strand:- start:1143 stop:2465 length:1323 start_codon:yes stop_codon:yes gene_type:complete